MTELKTSSMTRKRAAPRRGPKKWYRPPRKAIITSSPEVDQWSMEGWAKLMTRTRGPPPPRPF
ncbi:hypothetical protein CSW31_03960 [Thermus scotoductus]|nr:hypothetical protein CSW31_03960 [Thermus scotoductus]